MGRSRQSLFVWIITTVVVGLMSRLDMVKGIVPLGVGDLLYATLVYFIVAMLWLNLRRSTVFIFAFCFCAIIEFAQLLQWPFLIELQANWLGKLVLGSNFKWFDLVRYFFGTTLGLWCDHRFIQKPQNLTTV